MSADIRRSLRTNNRRENAPGHYETIDRFGEAEVHNLTTGGSCFVRSTFCGMKSVSEESQENIQPRRV